MNARYFVAMMATVLTVSSPAWSATPTPTIVGGAHDFSDWTSTGADDYGGRGQICKPCHTPHNAIASDVSSALWNHTLSTVSYKLHGSAVYDDFGNWKNIATNPMSSPGGAVELDAATRLCLSCHDGTVALDAFGGAIDPTTGKMIGKKNLKADLSNDHPVGIDAATDPATNLFAGEDLRTPDKIKETLPLMHLMNGTDTVQAVGCMSCHDPHMNSTAMLRIANVGSALCMTCHNK